jgi:hypothetical protein
MEETNIPTLTLDIDNKKIKLINLYTDRFTDFSLKNFLSRYTKIEDKERKIAIFNIAVHSWEDYRLVFQSTTTSLPFYSEDVVIKKDHIRIENPKENITLLLNKFEEPWYVRIEYDWLTGSYFEKDFMHPKVFIIPESELKEIEERQLKSLARISNIYKELLNYPPYEISEFKEGNIVEGNFYINRSGSIRTKQEILCPNYALITGKIIIPSTTMEERNSLKNGFYRIKGILRSTSKYYEFCGWRSELFLEIREAKMIKKMEEEGFLGNTEEYKWNIKKSLSLKFNSFKGKSRVSLFRVNKSITSFILAIFIMLAIAYFVWSIVQFLLPPFNRFVEIISNVFLTNGTA